MTPPGQENRAGTGNGTDSGTTARARTAIVIGGGIAGPAVAMALRKAGVEATIYEAYDTTADGIGGGISIAPNGLDALGAIDADEPVRAIGTPLYGNVITNAQNVKVAELALPEELPPLHFVWRTDLYRTLHDQSRERGITTHRNKKFLTAEESPTHITAHFADGSTAQADILIGADGIRSTVRTLINAENPPPHYAGLLGFAAPLADTRTPPTGGKLHITHGKRASFGYLSQEDRSGGWFANLPHPEHLTLQEVRKTTPQEWLRTLRAAYTDDDSPAVAMLDLTDPDQLLMTGPLELTPPTPTWHRGRIVLVGDSLHATSPTSGQGASLALESAVQLARCLRDHPHPEAFAAYEALRRPRVEEIIEQTDQANQTKARPEARKTDPRHHSATWHLHHHIDWNSPT
ncbi:FAD-dependent oxidoreductase [Streptomyces sp. SCSIO ZS0520]|uniref:FAD-dependent oxidoreductase n=1 Tax=Streptomyces sp. SCSIO ZS0520 TaxID=2892996 RepID=UPI0021D98E85|nr:NAD(P)/FAD-dependent oxidoreductase [Streptomyces sp. SCSIO ZS0520]